MAEEIVLGKPLPGDRSTEIAIKREEGMVLIAIYHIGEQKLRWARLQPELALQIGEQLAKEAYTALYNAPPPRSALKDWEIEKKRKTLVNRFMTLTRQMRERKRTELHIATELVDRALQEILL